MLFKRYKRLYGQIDSYKHQTPKNQEDCLKISEQISNTTSTLKPAISVNTEFNRQNNAEEYQDFENLNNLKINPLIIMRVEISPQIFRTVKVNKDDNPWSLSQKFCFHYGLDDSATDYLAHMIRTQLIKEATRDTNECIEQSDITVNFGNENQQDNDIFGNRKIRGSVSSSGKCHDYDAQQKEHKRRSVGNESSMTKNMASALLNRNKGEEQYQKGIKIKENSKQSISQLAKELEERNSIGLTFNPKISKTHKRVQSHFKGDKFLDRMLEDQYERRSVIIEQRNSVHKDNCTFKPSINKISDEIVKNKTMDCGIVMPAHENLHNYSKIRKNNLITFAEACLANTGHNFKPNQNKSQNYTAYKVKNEPFLVREDAHVKKKQMKLDLIKDKEEEKLRNSFQPKVGRGPSGLNRPRKSIHDHLYSYNKVYEHNLESLKTTQVAKQKNPSLKAIEVSDTIVDSLIIDKCEKQYFIIISHLDIEDIEMTCSANDLGVFCEKYDNVNDKILEVQDNLKSDLQENDSHIDKANFLAYFKNYYGKSGVSRLLAHQSELIPDKKRDKGLVVEHSYQVTIFYK